VKEELGQKISRILRGGKWRSTVLTSGELISNIVVLRGGQEGFNAKRVIRNKKGRDTNAGKRGDHSPRIKGPS